MPVTLCYTYVRVCIIPDATRIYEVARPYNVIINPPPLSRRRAVNVVVCKGTPVEKNLAGVDSVRLDRTSGIFTLPINLLRAGRGRHGERVELLNEYLTYVHFVCRPLSIDLVSIECNVSLFRVCFDNI